MEALSLDDLRELEASLRQGRRDDDDESGR